MFDEIRYWFEDHPAILPGLAVSFIILLVLGSLIWVVEGMRVSNPVPSINNGSTIIVNGSLPFPSIEPTATPIVNGSPSPTVEIPPDYNDYLTWRENYKNKTTPGNPTATPLLSGDPALENSVRIYVPTPIPCPTPTPTPEPDYMSQEKHTMIRGYDGDKLHNEDMSITPGVLALDAEHSYTGYGYYYTGDTIVLRLRFVNQWWNPIKDPTCHLTINRTEGMTSRNIVDTWSTENATIDPLVNIDGKQISGSYTKWVVFPIPQIPGVDGFYHVEVTLYGTVEKPNDVQASILRKDIDILWKPF